MKPESESIVMLTAGYIWTEAIIRMKRGEDLEKVEVPVVAEQALADLADEIQKVEGRERIYRSDGLQEEPTGEKRTFRSTDNRETRDNGKRETNSRSRS